MMPKWSLVNSLVEAYDKVTFLAKIREKDQLGISQ